jgi:hypothetical protein
LSIHTALLDLPAILNGLGLNVVVSDGWEDGQCDLISAASIEEAMALGEFRSEGDEPFDRDLEVANGGVWDHYRWTDPDTGVRSHSNPPSSYMVHHTAGASATIPSVNDSKANAWIGLMRDDGRLYQYGSGVPTIALVSAGPARISAGSGYKPAAWDYTFKNLRAPWKAEGRDTVDSNGNKVYLNRFAFSIETVCEGVGTTLDASVWDHVVGLGNGLHQLFRDWDERTLGHASWTTRKPDPDWVVGLPNDGPEAIIDIQDAISEGAGTMARWIYPKQSEPPTTTDAKFILEAFQVAAVKADTQSDYDGATSTTSFLADNGITVGVWDDAFVALIARLCPWNDGTAIGPREEARILSMQPGIKGDDGKVDVGTVLDLSTTATVTAVS